MFIRFVREQVPGYAHRLMLASLCWNCVVYYGGRIATSSLPHMDLTTAFDRTVPFCPWAVTIYFLAFVYWSANYILSARREREKVYRFFLADYIARTISLVIFVFYPTTMPRPDLVGGGIWNSLMSLLFALDEPNMLFPSFHCLNSCLAVLALWGDEKIPRWYRLLSVVIALSICVSTLLTRQHVLADVLAGIAVALLAYAIAGAKKLFPRYYALASR